MIMNIRDLLVEVAEGPYQIAQDRCSSA